MNDQVTKLKEKSRKLLVPIAVAGFIGFAIGFWGISSAQTQPKTTSAVVHGHWDSFPRTRNEKYGGSEGVIASSNGGRLVAGVFTHSGSYSYTFPFDEFAFVTSGSVQITVKGQPTFKLEQGHFVFFPKGTTAEFVAGENYANIAVLAGRQKIKW